MHRLCFTLFVSLCVGELPFHTLYWILPCCVCMCIVVVYCTSSLYRMRMVHTIRVWYVPYTYGMFFCTIRVWVVPYAYICFAQHKTF